MCFFCFKRGSNANYNTANPIKPTKEKKEDEGAK